MSLSHLSLFLDIDTKPALLEKQFIVWVSSPIDSAQIVSDLTLTGCSAKVATTCDEVAQLFKDASGAVCIFSGYLKQLVQLENALWQQGLEPPAIVILSEATTQVRSREHNYLVLQKPFSLTKLIEGGAEQNLLKSRPMFSRRLGHLALYENSFERSLGREGGSAKHLLNVFQESLDFQLENLYYGLQMENWDQVLVAARALAGNSNTAGVRSFFELSRALENAARSKSFMSARLLVSDLTAEANRLKERLEMPMALAA